MFSACKDIAFLEQLVEKSGFGRSYFVMAADDPLFYKVDTTTPGIYQYFRGGLPICGEIKKPAGKTNECIIIRGWHSIDWKSAGSSMKYRVVAVGA